MRRDPENSSDLIYLEFAGLQELGLLWRDPDGRKLHALFQHGDLVRVAAAAEGGLPAFADTLRILNGAGVFEDASGGCTVREKLRAIFLCGDGETNRIFCHCDGTIPNQTIKTKTGYVQHIFRLEDDSAVFRLDRFVVLAHVAVIQPPVFVSVNGHLVRHQWVQSNDLTFAVADDLRVGVAPQKQVRHECLAEYEARHFRVRLVMEETVKWVLHSLLFASVAGVLVHVQWQTCDGLR